MNDEEMISAEEFFGVSRKKKNNAPVRRGKARGRRVDKDLLAELKLKMVMRIYKVSRARAAAIIAGRADGRQALEEAREAAREDRRRRMRDEGFVPAEDLFDAD